MSIIGRTQEQKTFATILRSNSPAFVALHGRRRVGKTYLIREYFHDKGTFFEAVGMKDANMALQLQNFSDALSTTFAKGQPLEVSTPIELSKITFVTVRLFLIVLQLC